MPKIIGIKERQDKAYTPEKEPAMENTETTAAETPAPKESTIEGIEEFFIEQGNLIETQIKSEIYDHCPVCTAATEFLVGLSKMIEDSLKTLDHERDAIRAVAGNDKAEHEIKLNSLFRLKRDLAWYDTARAALANLLQAGHEPENVMRSHPELIVSKTQKRVLRSGKHRKQIAKESRRKNRTR